MIGTSGVQDASGFVIGFAGNGFSANCSDAAFEPGIRFWRREESSEVFILLDPGIRVV